MNNSTYLRRRSKIVLPTGTASELPPQYVASVLKQAEALGFTFSEPLINGCQHLALEQLTDLYHTLMPDLRRMKGANKKFRPMYPNFPAQVMEMDEGRLYFNAIIHYLSGGKLFPRTDAKERKPLEGNPKLQVIELGTEEEFESLFGQITASNTSLSEQDREDLTWFVSSYGEEIERLLPAAVPQKETMAFLASLLLKHTAQAEPFIARFCRTATDILRLAVALSGGDVSLAGAAKFRTFSRPERRLLLGLLERNANPTEDMLRWKGRWIRLGEKLHIGEFKARYPRSWEAFGVLRNDLPFATFNSRVEKALADPDIAEALAVLMPRPGDLARRLDHLLRLDLSRQDLVIQAFEGAADKVSTPVLLQVMTHFQNRNDGAALRVFFPKGSLAKAHGEPNDLPPLPADVCKRIANTCQEALVERFKALPPLGVCYVDPNLSDYPVPFSQRSASKSFRTIPRGSKLPLLIDGKVLRLFVWWKNGTDRTDIDLSATMFDENFRAVDVVTYYELRCDGGVHSGDIVDAPNGASEFVDITLERMEARGIRYVAMTLGGYTPQPFCDLPECFAGWMSRSDAESGEIYDPRTVQDRLDLTSASRIAIPLVVDVQDRKLIWCDMALKNNPNFVNNVHANLGGIALTLQSLVTLKKPTLYDLFLLHAKARGAVVDTPNQAGTVFSVAAGTPFRLDEIGSQFLV
ncbi:MAG: TerD family protein [Janthinobacterium lividum]